MTGLRGLLSEGASLARIAVTNAPGVVRAGVLNPVRPSRLVRMASAWWQWRSSVATLGAVAAARWPDRTALVDDLGALSYAELDRRASALAGALVADYGIGPGSSIAVMCRNHRGFVEGVLAAGRTGADLVLLNTEFPAPTLAKVLQRHEIDVVICDEEFDARFVAAGHRGPTVLAWCEDREGQAARTVDALVRRGLTGSRPESNGKLVILTSGTTGVPKGVPRTLSALGTLAPGITALTTLSLRSGESMLIGPPLFHGFGLAFFISALTLGDTMILRRRFDPEVVLADIERHRVHTALVVPVMLQRMIAARAGQDTSSLKVLCSGASALTPALADRATAAFGHVLYNGYGSSEVGMATLATPDDLRDAPGTVGRPLGGIQVALLDDEGHEVPEGDTGRIFVGSALAFEGYSGGGGKEVVNGLMSTGDLGFFDPDGRLFVAGREDDMIVSGGENVFPLEVENALARHESVADVAVIGVPDEEFGQRLKAFVVPAGPGVRADELIEYLNQLVSRFMVPREIVLVDDLPRNATGKVLRSQLS